MEAAFKLFAEKGTHFSLSEVTKEVGIQKASFYAHFTSKEMLLYQLIDKEIDEYFFEINEENRDLKSIFFTILNYYDESKTKLFFWKRLLLFPPKSFQTTLIQKINSLSENRYKIITEVINDNIEKGLIREQDTQTIALSYISMIHGILSSIIIYDKQNLTTYYENIWQNFWKGIN